MMSSLGAKIFWMISIGLILGYASYFVFMKYSIRLGLSLFLSTLGAVLVGMIAYYFAFDLPLMYAVLGGILFLFLANAFLSQEE